tara:strand:+ start:3926 stop:4132 length:207 start_codon:yes stop_codon:yes gene_type:complete
MIIYIVRYEDGDVEFCSFFRNKKDAMKGRTQFKREFGKMGSVERKVIGRDKSGFIDLFHRFAIQSATR